MHDDIQVARRKLLKAMAAFRGAALLDGLGFDVLLVVTDLLLSLRGGVGKVSTNVALRFVWFGTVAYLIVSLQGSMQAFMPISHFIHFSDWVGGDAEVHWLANEKRFRQVAPRVRSDAANSAGTETKGAGQ